MTGSTRHLRLVEQPPGHVPTTSRRGLVGDPFGRVLVEGSGSLMACGCRVVELLFFGRDIRQCDFHAAASEVRRRREERRVERG